MALFSCPHLRNGRGAQACGSAFLEVLSILSIQLKDGERERACRIMWVVKARPKTASITSVFLPLARTQVIWPNLTLKKAGKCRPAVYLRRKGNGICWPRGNLCYKCDHFYVKGSWNTSEKLLRVGDIWPETRRINRSWPGGEEKEEFSLYRERLSMECLEN